MAIKTGCWAHSRPHFPVFHDFGILTGWLDRWLPLVGLKFWLKNNLKMFWTNSEPLSAVFLDFRLLTGWLDRRFFLIESEFVFWFHSEWFLLDQEPFRSISHYLQWKRAMCDHYNRHFEPVTLRISRLWNQFEMQNRLKITYPKSKLDLTLENRKRRPIFWKRTEIRSSWSFPKFKSENFFLAESWL